MRKYLTNLIELVNVERFSDWSPNVQKCGNMWKYVEICGNLVDLVKSFQTTIYYLLAKIGVGTAENGPLKACQQFGTR